MKKFLSAAIAVLMIVSLLPMAVFANGFVEFSMGKVSCAPGERISVPVYVKSSADVNSLALSEMSYDESLLTFVGFENYSDLVTDSLFGKGAIDKANKTIMLGYMDSFMPNGRICNVVFEVSEKVVPGTVIYIYMNSLAKNGAVVIDSSFTTGIVEIKADEPETAAPETAAPELGDPTALTIGKVKCDAGDRIYVEVLISGSQYANSFAASDLIYDKNVLTFVGFDNYGSFVTDSFFGTKTMDEEKGIVCVGYDEPVLPNGKICDLVFDVNRGAAGSSTGISFGKFVVKNCAEELENYMFSGYVEVSDFDVIETVPPVGAPIVLELGDLDCDAGDRINVPVNIFGTVEADSFAAADLIYDSDVFTFVKFGNYGSFVKESLFGSMGFDKTNKAMAIGYEEEIIPEGKVCDLIFDVNPNAPEGVYVIDFGSFVTKLGPSEIDNAVSCAYITVGAGSSEGPIETEAPETEAPETAAPETEDIQVEFLIENWVVEPGESVFVGLYISSDVPINSIALSELQYDTERLELVRFTNRGEFVQEAPLKKFDKNMGVIAVGLDESRTFDHEKICDMEFKVKDTAPYGSCTITMDSIVKEDSLVYSSAVDFGTVYVGSVGFTLGNACVEKGGTFNIPLYIEATAPINSVALSHLGFNEDVMSFIGFEGWENSEILESAEFCTFDAANKVLAFATANGEPEKLSGYLCDLVFTVFPDADPGEYFVNFGLPVTKCDSEEIFSYVTRSSVCVGKVMIKGESEMSLPGDTVDVFVRLEESDFDDIMSLSVVMDSYDTEGLEFLGYVMAGQIYEESEYFYTEYAEALSLGCVPTGLRFKVKENAPAGMYPINLSATAFNANGNEVVTVITQPVITVGKGEITVGTAAGAAGETISVPVTISADRSISFVSGMDLVYDQDTFTFVGFDTSTLEGVHELEWNDDGSFRLIIGHALGISNVTFNLLFTVNEDAEDGLYVIGYENGESLNIHGFEFITESIGGGFEVVSCISGDINGDKEVNVQDALYLFLHTMLPNNYPMNYKKPVDFTKDGQVNVQDALYLFLYSMLGDKYPID